MSKKKKAIPRSLYRYCFVVEFDKSIIYTYKLPLNKKLEKVKYCYHDILIRTKNSDFRHGQVKTKNPKGKFDKKKKN